MVRPALTTFEDSELRREDRIAAADRELQELNAAALVVLRQRVPSLFDSRGRLRRRAFRQFLMVRSGGRSTLSKPEIVALSAEPASPVHASR